MQDNIKNRRIMHKGGLIKGRDDGGGHYRREG